MTVITPQRWSLVPRAPGSRPYVGRWPGL